MNPGERLSPARGSRAVADAADRRSGGLPATLGREAGVLDLFGWLRGTDGRTGATPPPARRTIAQPVKGPMSTGRVEQMNHQRVAMPPAVITRREPSARTDGGAPPRGRQGPAKADPVRHSGTQGFLAAHGVERSFVGRKVVKGVSLYVRRGDAV